VARTDATPDDDRRQSRACSASSKRGIAIWRKNLIHGARAVLPYWSKRETPLGRWARGLLARAHKNIVVVAWPQAGAHRLGGAGAGRTYEAAAAVEERIGRRTLINDAAGVAEVCVW